VTSAGQGQRAATIYSVAHRAGVSIATVSRVLQGGTATSAATREKVLRAVAELQYVPLRAARSLAVQRHEAHGLVIPELRGPFYSDVLMGYETAAAHAGQSVLLALTRRRADAMRVVGDLMGRVDGLVIGPATIPDAAAAALGRKKPVVLVARPAVPGCDAITSESAGAARDLVAHLMSRHRRSHLVFVGDPDAEPDVAERYRGFRHAHAAADIPVRRPPLRVPTLEAAGLQVADEVVRRRVKVGGLVCANDELALAVMKRLLEHGVRVPDDMVVTGWDDVMAARYVTPSLTTVRQSMQELGRGAAVRLHERIGGAPVLPEPVVLPTELVLRASCGCVPRSP